MMRTIVGWLLRAGVLAVIAVGLVLSGPAGLRTEPPSAEAALLSEVKKLLASEAQALDEFGFSVAVSGDTAVVGATGGVHSEYAAGVPGAAYVFGRDQDGTGNWGEVKKLTASDAQAHDLFGVSVAVSGDTAVVGASHHAGASYIFERDEGGADNWGEVKKLTASDAQADDRFGSSVAVSGNAAVVGASGEDAGGSDAGAAYVFERDEGGADSWGEVKKLTASDGLADDRFGESVAVSGDTAVVGARHEYAGGTNAGAAYVFRREHGGTDNWAELAKLTASDGEFLDRFGTSVAVSADTAVVGATGEDAGGDRAGAAYVFRRDEGGADNWGEVKKLTASDAENLDAFGSSVAVSGDTAIVGAFREDTGGFSAGAAYVFERDQGGADNWGEVKKLTASDAEASEWFGYSVGVSGDTIIVGAPWEDAGGHLAGAAYVFEEPPPAPTATPLAGAPSPVATQSPSELPETGASRPTTGVSLESVLLLALGGAALALGGAAWYVPRLVRR